MPIEPTSLERQRLAFAYLRDQATRAHLGGDGLLTSLLCHNGLDYAKRFADESRLHLPLAELAWMPILSLYWLLNRYELVVVQQTLKSLPKVDPEDATIGEWLDIYVYVIEQPLGAAANLIPRLCTIPWPSFFSSRSIEVETLLTHLIELAWYCGPSGSKWQEVLMAWGRSGSKWAQEIFQRLRTRLMVQTRLTAPSQKYPAFGESSLEDLKRQSAFAELWLFELHGRKQSVRATVERLTANVSGDSHDRRILTDFGTADRFLFAENEDAESVQLARRHRLSADVPLLIFHDKRHERIQKLLAEIFRAESETVADRRWQVLTLAMLQELSALGLWDYGMWLEAIRAQSEALLESARWGNDVPELVVQGLVLAARSQGARDPNKDRITREAVNTLEFASSMILAELAEGLLATYPQQKHSAMELLGDLTDLLPASFWPALAEWTISYASESAEWRTRGQRIAPTQHWYWTLPALSADSPVWDTLQTEVLKLARTAHSWVMNETNRFLRQWLSCAPKEKARETGEAIAAVSVIEPHESRARIQLLIFIEEKYPDLRGTFTGELPRSELSESHGLQLARHLGHADLDEREQAIYELSIKLIRQLIARATPADLNRIEIPLGAPQEIYLVTKWRPEERALLEQLINAVDNPSVLSAVLPHLLVTITVLVANGPIEFAEFVQSHIRRWTELSPQGAPTPLLSGPFSIFQVSGDQGEAIAVAVGALALQVWRRLGTSVRYELLSWSKAMLLEGYARPMPLVVLAGVVVALSSAGEGAEDGLSLAETSFLSLWAKSANEPKEAKNLAEALHYLGGLFGAKDSEVIDWASQSIQSRLERVIALFERFVPRFSKSPNAEIRGAVAELLGQIKRREPLTTKLSEVLVRLGNDNRARVRVQFSKSTLDAS